MYLTGTKRNCRNLKGYLLFFGKAIVYQSGLKYEQKDNVRHQRADGRAKARVASTKNDRRYSETRAAHDSRNLKNVIQITLRDRMV